MLCIVLFAYIPGWCRNYFCVIKYLYAWFAFEVHLCSYIAPNQRAHPRHQDRHLWDIDPTWNMPDTYKQVNHIMQHEHLSKYHLMIFILYFRLYDFSWVVYINHQLIHRMWIYHNWNICLQNTPVKRMRNLRCWLHRWSWMIVFVVALQWRHNERDGDSNYQPHDCLLNSIFKAHIKGTSKLRVTGLCEGNSPLTGGFHAQRASNAVNVSIWWRHHGQNKQI